MKYPNKEYIEHLRRKYPPGTRLQLSCMEDEFPVPPGSMGTVECIDDAGQMFSVCFQMRTSFDSAVGICCRQ